MACACRNIVPWYYYCLRSSHRRSPENRSPFHLPVWSPQYEAGLFHLVYEWSRYSPRYSGKSLDSWENGMTRCVSPKCGDIDLLRKDPGIVQHELADTASKTDADLVTRQLWLFPSLMFYPRLKNYLHGKKCSNVETEMKHRWVICNSSYIIKGNINFRYFIIWRIILHCFNIWNITSAAISYPLSLHIPYFTK